MGLSVDTEVPCGNARALRAAGSEIRFEADPHDAARSMWWCFRVRGETGREVTCTQEDVRRVLGASGLAAARPVVRAAPGGPWRRLPAAACRFDGARFTFRLRLPGPEAHVAYCHPYGEAELAPLLAECALHPAARVESVGTSALGRPVRLVRIDETCGGECVGVMLTARHHAGETPGSFALEGLLRRVLCNDPLGRRLRARCEVVAIPWMDVDGVAEGRYGKERPPIDFNRDWSSAPSRPEVRLAQAALADLATRHERLFFFDLHAPAPGDGNFVVPVNLTLSPHGAPEPARVLADAIVAACPRYTYLRAFRDDPGPMAWSLDLGEATSTGYARRVHGVPALSLELSYHERGDGCLNSPRAWRGHGAAVAGGLDAFLRGAAPPPRPVTDAAMAQMLAVHPHWAFWQRPLDGVFEADATSFGLSGTGASVAIARGHPVPMASGQSLELHFGCTVSDRSACRMRLRTLFYDSRGARIPAVDERVLEPCAGREAHLAIAAPPGAAAARPGWWVDRLDGSLRVTWIGASSR